jgi:hypothetical protein
LGLNFFREIQARDFCSLEYGAHAWTRVLPLNERDVKNHGEDARLNTISLTVLQQVAHAILLRSPLIHQQYHAGHCPAADSDAAGRPGSWRGAVGSEPRSRAAPL